MLLLFPKEKGKEYEQNPKIRSFQIKTNKISEITDKGVGYTRVGISTKSVLATPREPFLSASVLVEKDVCLKSRMRG